MTWGDKNVVYLKIGLGSNPKANVEPICSTAARRPNKPVRRQTTSGGPCPVLVPRTVRPTLPRLEERTPMRPDIMFESPRCEARGSAHFQAQLTCKKICEITEPGEPSVLPQQDRTEPQVSRTEPQMSCGEPGSVQVSQVSHFPETPAISRFSAFNNQNPRPFPHFRARRSQKPRHFHDFISVPLCSALFRQNFFTRLSAFTPPETPRIFPTL